MSVLKRAIIFIDELIPPEEKSNNPLLYKTAFLKATLMTLLAFIGSVVAFLYAYMDAVEGDFLVSVVDFAVGCVLLFGPLVARKRKNLESVALLSVFLLGVMFLIAVFDELPEDKASLIWLSVVPALSFLIKGRKALYWSAGYLIIHFLTVTLSGKLTMSSLIDAYLSYTLITVIFYFYAWMSERYREVWSNMAMTDSLTGILNRLAFETIALKEISKAVRTNTDLSIILFDIDNFKQINDRYGHVYGDFILRTVAEIVSRSLRTSDIFARWGGEEFVVLLPNTNGLRAINVAEKIRSRIQFHRFDNGLKVTASFGVANLKSCKDFDNLILKADEALYRAKERGKNRVEACGLE